MPDQISTDQVPSVNPPGGGQVPPINPEMTPPLQPPVDIPTEPTKKPGRGLIIGLILLLLTTGAAGYFGYNYWQMKQKPNPEVQPTEQTQPTQPEETNPTADWQTYTNTDFSFKYPPDWIIEEVNNNRLVGKNPEVIIFPITEGQSLMNECMKLDKVEEGVGYVVKRFSRVITGAMCGTNDSSPREIWVIPSEEDYSPAISYSYSAKDSFEAERIFNQILSTFRFLEEVDSTLSTHNTYKVKLSLKSAETFPSEEDFYFLMNYLKSLFGLLEETEIKIAFDTRRDDSPWSGQGAKYNFTYYLAFEEEKVELKDRYEDQYLVATTEPVPNLYSYIMQADYCEADNDCVVRSNFCTYGSYNYYHGFAEGWGCGPPSDKTGYTFEIYDENRGCTTDVQIADTKCIDNKCTDQGRVIVCKEE